MTCVSYELVSVRVRQESIAVLEVVAFMFLTYYARGDINGAVSTGRVDLHISAASVAHTHRCF
jgi:hypothetical protein